ncbi:uncharacterized protein [Montipora capricornis]|uniref:uncharacterized protein n=1 Tax=Montipora capricornis TaxID=246305 RepID=UPI0035F1D2A4
MSRLESELGKLKEVFRSSKDCNEWTKSDKVCGCTDQEFDHLLRNLKSRELEAAVLILQRHIDLEKQIWKCLENLKSIQSGWKGKRIDVTQKLISSQCKVARLRSRLLRCFIQQLCNEGSSEVYLPSWSGIDVISGDNKKKDSPNDGECIEQQHVSKDDPTAVTGQSTNNESSRVDANSEDLTYSNIEGVHISMSTSSNGTDSESKRVNVNPEDLTYSNIENVQSVMNASTNAESQVLQMSPGRERAPECIYEIAPPPASPSKPYSPSKPKPYSVSKKEKSGRTRCVGAEKPEGTILKQDCKTLAYVQPPVDADQLDEEDAWIVENHHLQDWDPTPVLQELFGDVRPLQATPLHSEEAKVDNIRMAGYMEKLPVKSSQKKGSVFKSWKKRHFKAVGGKLFYYEDHRALQPLGFVNLVHCIVKKVEDKLLEVVEEGGGGKSLKLKCSSIKEAEDWKEALEAESVVLTDNSPPTDELSATEGSTIIIDLGSSSVKAGFVQEDAWPQVIFPCVIAVDKENPESCAYGYTAFLPEKRKNSRLRFPLRKSLKIDKLKFDTLDLIGIFEHVFDNLKVDPSKHKVIMTLPHGSGPQEKEELVGLLLDQFQVEACYLQEQAILAMYSYSAISGIVVDIGDHIDVFPVVEGCMIEAGTTRLPYGGRQMTDSFTRMLTEKGVRLFSEVESYVSRVIKEKVSFVAKREAVENEDEDCSMIVDLEKYSIPDGTREVTVDSARYRCTEGLFKPSAWGKDHPGIHQLTVKAIMACSIDMRKQMCRNIYLSGGGSMSAGLAERLQAEVSELVPFSSHVQVHAGVERQYAAFIGASVVANLPLFDELCVSKDDWDELGPEALAKWLTL